MGIRLMIIELLKYIEVRELLIEKRSIGSQAQVIYWDRDRRVSVTRVAVHMEGKGRGCELGTGVHTIGLRVGNENRHAYEHCGATKEALACNEIEIDHKKRGLGLSGPRVASYVVGQRGGVDDAWLCTHHVMPM